MNTGTSIMLAGALLFGAAVNSASANAELVIYNFPDSSNPFPSLLKARGGTLYGAAFGSGGTGLIYTLANKSDGWKYKTIHNFDINDGSGPSAALIEDM